MASKWLTVIHDKRVRAWRPADSDWKKTHKWHIKVFGLCKICDTEIAGSGTSLTNAGFNAKRPGYHVLCGVKECWNSKNGMEKVFCLGPGGPEGQAFCVTLNDLLVVTDEQNRHVRYRGSLKESTNV